MLLPDNPLRNVTIVVRTSYTQHNAWLRAPRVGLDAQGCDGSKQHQAERGRSDAVVSHVAAVARQLQLVLHLSQTEAIGVRVDRVSPIPLVRPYDARHSMSATRRQRLSQRMYLWVDSERAKRRFDVRQHIAVALGLYGVGSGGQAEIAGLRDCRQAARDLQFAEDIADVSFHSTRCNYQFFRNLLV